MDGRCAMKRAHVLLLLPLLLAGCTEGPDMGPVGGGLAIIGLGIVLAAAILALGKGGS